jgi:hypothetical protein
LPCDGARQKKAHKALVAAVAPVTNLGLRVVDIRDYRHKVKLIADLRNGRAVFNGSTDHASVIVENLFRVANHQVRILSGDLDARVYGNANVVQRAQEFLGHSDHKLDVLVEEATFSASHPFVRAISGNDNVSIKLIDQGVSSGIPYHFMTADEDCYRFEEQKGTHKAVAAFGDRAAMHLTEIYQQIEPFAKAIELAELRNA